MGYASYFEHIREAIDAREPFEPAGDADAENKSENQSAIRSDEFDVDDDCDS
jgi:hypothetical protein